MGQDRERGLSSLGAREEKGALETIMEYGGALQEHYKHADKWGEVPATAGTRTPARPTA